jgi:hypothetical protein
MANQTVMQAWEENIRRRHEWKDLLKDHLLRTERDPVMALLDRLTLAEIRAFVVEIGKYEAEKK